MKIQKLACIVFLLLFCLILCNCFSEQENGNTDAIESDSQRDGECLIGLEISKDTLFFSKQGGIDSLTMTSGWLPNIFGCEHIKTDHYILDGGDMIKIESDYCKNNYCEQSSALAHSSSNSARTMKIECSWFSVAKTSANSILVSVNENDTGEERNKRIILSAGNCASSFTITQAEYYSPF